MNLKDDFTSSLNFSNSTINMNQYTRQVHSRVKFLNFALKCQFEIRYFRGLWILNSEFSLHRICKERVNSEKNMYVYMRGRKTNINLFQHLFKSPTLVSQCTSCPNSRTKFKKRGKQKDSKRKVPCHTVSGLVRFYLILHLLTNQTNQRPLTPKSSSTLYFHNITDIKGVVHLSKGN